MTVSARVFIAGTGMTPFGKGCDLRKMSEAAAGDAARDAGISSSEVERIYFGNGAAGVIGGQEMVRGQAALRFADLAGAQVVNVENACASGSTALMLAFEAVAAGRCEVVLAMGAEQMWHEDRRRTFLALQGATDVNDPLTSDDEKHSVFMDVYADEAKRYMAEYGATTEDLAAVAVKNRRHAAQNPKAHYRTPQTIEQVIGDRVVADPLTLSMCSPTTDGSAALVVCSEDAARRLDRSLIEVLTVEMARGRGTGSQPVREATNAAFEATAVGPDDLDLIELHDAAAPAELIQYAEIGLCDEGEGHALLRTGATQLGGRLPVNTSGGLLSRGHPLGATGCAQVVELTDQLRGRAGTRQVADARVALAVNGGGWIGGSYALAVATILRRTA